MKTHTGSPHYLSSRFTGAAAATGRLVSTAQTEMLMELQCRKPDFSAAMYCPLFMVRIAAGFPSPAADDMEGRIDLNRHLVNHPAATFYVRVSGDSMIVAGIHDDDMLIVDRALYARNGSVVVAVLAAEFTVKRLRIRGKQMFLLPENDP